MPPIAPAPQRKPGLPYRLFCGACASIFGAILAGLPLHVFLDRDNYLFYVVLSRDVLAGHLHAGLVAMLANEPVWLLVNAALSSVLAPETAMRAIIFFPAAVVAYLVLSRDPRHLIWLAAFLLLPQVLKNHVVHLRQGVAIAVFLAGWFSARRFWRATLLLAAPFIHASFFFVLILLICVNAAKRLRFSGGLRAAMFAFIGLSVGLGLAWLAALLGARQSLVYDFAAADISGLGFLFWLLVLGVMLAQGRNYAYRHAFEIGTVIFYLATYFFLEVTARIFESTMLLVLLAGLRLTGWRRAVFLALIVAYGALQWYLRSGRPWAGFGLG